MAKDISTEIGFEGGTNAVVGVPEDSVDTFLNALKQGKGEWYEVASSDGATLLVDTSKVVFVRLASTSKTIGFANT